MRSDTVLLALFHVGVARIEGPFFVGREKVGGGVRHRALNKPLTLSRFCEDGVRLPTWRGH